MQTWLGLIEWARASMLSTDPPLANPEDLTIPVCVAGADEAITLIRNCHTVWLATQQQLRKPGGATARRKARRGC
jgi:hypothetical protein